MKLFNCLLLILIGIISISYPVVSYNPPSDFPYVTPYIFMSISDDLVFWEHVPIQNRVVTYISGATFDAQAVYNVGVHPYFVSPKYIRPVIQHKETNRNIAVTYAAYGVTKALLPSFTEKFNDMMERLGLDPTDTSRDPNTPQGMGNIIADAVVSKLGHDGANQFGDLTGLKHNLMNYSDYSNYAPVNTFDRLVDPTRWQPLVVDDSRTGLFRVQQQITPFWKFTKPWAHPNPAGVLSRPPRSTYETNPKGFFAEVKAVLDASSKLTDKQKLTAEFFEEKIIFLGTVLLHLAEQKGLSGLEFSAYDFGLHMATSDAFISSWGSKDEVDYIRPVSAIRHFLADKDIRAYARNEGVVTMKGAEYNSYLNTGAHSEHPSGTSCICSAWAEYSRRFFGSDELKITLPYAKGSSFREPGHVPAEDTELYFETFTEAEHHCARSRIWAGVHFPDAVYTAQEVCRKFGATAYDQMAGMLGYDLSEDRVPMPPGIEPEVPDYLDEFITHPEDDDDDDDDRDCRGRGRRGRHCRDDDRDDDDRDDDDRDDNDDDDRDCRGRGRGRHCRDDDDNGRGRGKDKDKGRGKGRR